MEVLDARNVTRPFRPVWFKVQVGSRRVGWLMSVALLALVPGLSGCQTMNHKPEDGPGLFRGGPKAALPNGAMLDHDFKSWPGGTAVPPAGLGIDAVRPLGTSAQ